MRFHPNHYYSIPCQAKRLPLPLPFNEGSLILVHSLTHFHPHSPLHYYHYSQQEQPSWANSQTPTGRSPDSCTGSRRAAARWPGARGRSPVRTAGGPRGRRRLSPGSGSSGWSRLRGCREVLRGRKGGGWWLWWWVGLFGWRMLLLVGEGWGVGGVWLW